MEPPQQYDAFISYRRSDGSRIAHQLRARLRGYKLPANLGREDTPQLSIFLDTIYERATEDFFETTIKPALERSRHLIVVRTPDALKPTNDGGPNWTEREIMYFRTLPQGRSISIALAEGAFDDPLPARLETDFVNIEKVDLRRKGRFRQREWDSEVLKFIATLHGIPHDRMPELRREEDRRRASRLRRTASLLVFVIVILAGLLTWALDSRDRFKKALSQANYQQAQNLDEKGEHAQTLAYLAASLRLDPTNLQAQSLLTDSLLRKSWPIPIAEFKAPGYISLSSDARRFMTGGTGVIHVFDTMTFKSIGRAVRPPKRGFFLGASGDLGRVVLINDSEVRLWDTSTGLPIGTAYPLQPSYKELLWAVPSPDASWLAFPRGSGLILRNLLTGQECKITDATPLQINIRFTADSRKFAFIKTSTADNSRMLEIIELDNRRLAGEIFPVPNLMGFDVSSSGTQILTTSSRGTLNLWDTEAGTVIRFFTKKASKNLAMRKIEFTSDNSMFVGLPMDGGALVWKTSESSPVTAIGNGSTFVSGEVSVDGHSLLTVSFDHRASTWDLRTGERLALSVPNVEVARWVTGSPNLIVTISSRNLLRIWSIRQQASCCPYIANEPLQEVNLKPSAGKIAIIKNEAIRVYGTDTLRPPQASIPHPKNSWVHDVLLSSDGAFVACSTLSQSGEMLSVWASASGRRIGPQVPSASGRQLGFGDLGYQFSPDSSLIAIIRNLGSLDLWDFHNGNHSIKLIHGDKLVAFRFSPKGDKIVTTGFDNKVKIWKTSSGMLLSEFFAKDVQFSTASFSPDGDFLVSGSLQGKVFKWNIESGQLVKLSGPLDEVLMVTFDSTGRFLVLTSSESVTILDSETMEPIGPPIRNADFASSASLDAKGERILLVHQQDRKTAGLWDVRAGKLLTSFVSSDGILDAQLSLDGNRLWFADSQGLKVFDVPILPAGETEPLARLAEAVAGYEVNDEGRLLSIQDRIHRLNELRRETANAPPRQARAQSLIRWFLADWRSRSLSPLSEITVPEYIRQRLAEGPDAREEILRTFPGHPLLRNVTWPETAGNHRSP